MHARTIFLAACLGLMAPAALPPALAAQTPAPPASTAAAAAANPQERKMTDKSTYPVAFASPRRDCALPVAVAPAAKGQVAWTRPTGPSSGEAPYSLLVWDGHFLTVRPTGLAAFDANGRLLWQRTRHNGSPPAVGNGLLYYENARCKMDAVDLANALSLDSVPYPAAMNTEYCVRLLWPRGGDFVSVSYWPGQDPDQPPNLTWDISEYGKRICRKGGQFRQAERLPPLFVPQTETIVLCMQEVVSIGTAEGGQTVQFKLPISKAADWSADAAGTLCLIGYQGTDKAVVALAPDGKETWRWTDTDKPDLWAAGQPPIRAGLKRVYALTGSRVLAIEDGKLAWQYQIKDQAVRTASALADGSLLVAAGKTLIHLDPAGKAVFSVTVEKDIVAPPVVDADGGIYVVAGVFLVKIQ